MLQKLAAALWLKLLAAAVIGLSLWMNLDHGPAFAALTGGRTIPDAMIGGYEVSYIRDLLPVLSDRPEAALILRQMHLGPDMVFPLLFALLLFGLMLRFAPGNRIFGIFFSGRALWLCLPLPLAYMLSDYAENLASLLLFPPAQPEAALAERLISALPTLTALKYMFGMISLMLVLRFWLGQRYLVGKNGDQPGGEA